MPTIAGCAPVPDGVTVTLLTVTVVTVTRTSVETMPDCTVITHCPAASAVTSPEAFTVATAGLLGIHAMPAAGGAVVLPSEFVHFAVSCCVAPTGRGGRLDGAMVTPCKIAVPTVSVAVPETDPALAVITELAVPNAAATADEYGSGAVPGAEGRFPLQPMRTMYACWPPLLKN